MSFSPTCRPVMDTDFVVDLMRSGSRGADGAPDSYRWRIVKSLGADAARPSASLEEPFSLGLSALDERDLEAFLEAEPCEERLRRLAGLVTRMLRSPNGELWESFLVHAASAQKVDTVRLVLRFSGDESHIVYRIPWEIVAGPYSADTPETGRVGRIRRVAPDVSVTRYWPISSPLGGPIEPPLRIGLLKGHPGKEPNRIAVEKEAEQLRKIVQELGADGQKLVELEEEWASEAGIRRLVNQGAHLVIFLGHGTEEGGEVQLETVREDPGAGSPRRRRMGVDSFANHLRAGTTSVRMVILNACSSAGSRVAFENGAAALLRQGIGAVLAIQGKVKVEAAHLFLQTFLQHVLEGKALDRATLAARQKVHILEHDRFPRDRWGDWARPVLLLGELDQTFSLSEAFQPLARRRRRLWREILSPPEEPGAFDTGKLEELKGKAQSPGTHRVVEEAPGAASAILGEALASLDRSYDVLPPLYKVNLPPATSPEPILASLRREAPRMEDRELIDDLQRLAVRSTTDPQQFSFPFDAPRVLVITGCDKQNRGAWEPFADLENARGLNLRLFLVGSPALGDGGAVRVQRPAGTAGEGAEALDLDRLPALQRQVLEALATLRKEVSAATVMRILEDHRALAILPELFRDHPGTLEHPEGAWRLTEPARLSIAAGLTQERAVDLHRRAARVFLSEAQD